MSAAAAPARDGRRLTPLVAECERTGGRDPAAYLREPMVVETERSVVVHGASDAPVD